MTMTLLDVANAASLPNDATTLAKLAKLLDEWGLDAADAVNKLISPEARAILDELRKVETEVEATLDRAPVVPTPLPEPPAPAA